MSDVVLVAIIAALSAVVVALIGVLTPVLVSISRHSKTAATQATQANTQVSNDHSTNLRVEGDERHHENREAIADLRKLVISGQRATVRRFTKLETRLGVVEHTIPRRTK